MAELAALAIAAGCSLAFCASVVAWQQYRRARRWRIRAEEADAWADEYARERDAFARQAAGLVEQNRQLRTECATLQNQMLLRTRQLLAHNYLLIEYNVRWRKRL